MLFIEILLSMHCLLFISSWVIGGNWLDNQPSYKLKLVRFLLVSCVIAPLLMHCVNINQEPRWHQYKSIDVLQEYINQPILTSKIFNENLISKTAISIENTSYCQLFYSLFCLLIIFGVYKSARSIWGLRELLIKTVPYRTSGKLVIKVSSHCYIPFSVALFNTAYIVLPVSLFTSFKNVKIAIAHEGQHHRQGDCIWVYFVEALRIIFYGNPGVIRWSRILSELQELACDEALIGKSKISPHDYGCCLFDVVQTAYKRSRSSNRDIACTVGMALNKDSTFIIRRISMLSVYSRKPYKSLLLGVAFVFCAILASICVAYAASGTLTSSKANEIDISNFEPRIQRIAEQEIKKAVNQYHAKSGVIAIANTKTGDIIAFAEDGNANHNNWKSRIFSPGSLIKPFIAAAAIDSGNSSATKIYDCHSPYIVEGRTFTDYHVSHDSTSLMQALVRSSNVCMIKVSQETGASVIRKKLTEFGFDMNSWWHENQSNELQLAMASVGENIPVTIGSLTKSYAILANNGRLFEENKTPVITESTSKSVNHILENVVKNGTGKLAVIPGVNVAGKTGTVVGNINSTKKEHLALFAGFLPVNQANYAIVVVIEDGHLSKNGKVLSSGGELAAPVFSKVAMNYLILRTKL